MGIKQYRFIYILYWACMLTNQPNSPNVNDFFHRFGISIA
jgi:hypothetical protein